MMHADGKQSKTILSTLRDAIVHLEGTRSETPQLDAEVLLAHLLCLDRLELYLKRDRPLSQEELTRFEAMLRERAKGRPVAAITGIKEFWSLRIAVSSDVLIPRPETEILVEEVLALAGDTNRPMHLLDLCTGSGCIAAALASELPRASLTITDISEQALQIAQRNLSFAQDRVTLHQGDLFRALPSAPAPLFDIITANPPYVEEGLRAEMAEGPTAFEPEIALFGGKYGLDFLLRIIKDAPHYMLPGGWLVLEMGLGQSQACLDAEAALGAYAEKRIARDLAGIERVILLKKASAEA